MLKSKKIKIFYLYKITNIKTNKIYIGYTGNSIKKRWGDHINNALKYKVKGKFYNAIRKYGKNSFKVEQICKCRGVKEFAWNIETYFIAKFDSTNSKNGYNTQKKGGGGLGEYIK